MTTADLGQSLEAVDVKKASQYITKSAKLNFLVSTIHLLQITDRCHGNPVPAHTHASVIMLYLISAIQVYKKYDLFIV